MVWPVQSIKYVLYDNKNIQQTNVIRDITGIDNVE